MVANLQLPIGGKRRAADMTRAVDLTTERGAGPVRTSYPQWQDLLPPCNHACPAGEDIQAWLALAQAGKYRQAWDVLMRDNPMPSVHGRVCYHPCEGACNRNELDAPVSIHAVERFLGDMAAVLGWRPGIDAAPSGKRVLVVGAGPAGLSAAYHLTRLGHAVEIHEAGPVPGGMMQFGIPAYRLPRGDLMKEIARIERMGVRIVLNRARRGPRRREAGRPVRRGVRGDRRACLQACRDSGPRRRPHARRGGLSARRGQRHAAAAWPPRDRLRRRQHRHGRRPHRAPPRCRRGDDCLSSRPRAHAGACLRGRRGARGRRQDQVADDHQGHSPATR